jgi:sec-independent protein translocase protein TatC
MATALRPIHHDDRLSLVEHLDELRTRLILCIVVFLAAFAVCFWQNDRILDIMDRPLEKSAFTKDSEDPLERSALFQESLKRLTLQLEVLSRQMARSENATAAEKAESPATRRCCWRCRSCSIRRTRSSYRRSRPTSGRSRCR